jgi:hypothetical protein
MRINEKNLANSYAGQRVILDVSIKNMPSMGITPDKPEYVLRTTTGKPLAFSRHQAELVALADEKALEVTRQPE